MESTNGEQQSQLRRSARIAERHSAQQTSNPLIPAVEKSTKRMCTTCYVKRAMTAFPEQLCSTQCKHNISTCRECMRRWISRQLDVVGFMRVRCPQCKESMDRDYLRLYSSEADHRRVQALERRAKAEVTPGWRWCLNPACDAGQVCGGQDQMGGTLTCEKCGAQACISCDRPSHPGKTCLEARAAHAEAETASDKKILRVAMPCPSCSRRIEKDGGCNEVLCTQCGTIFCWLCGESDAQIEARGGKHADGCAMNDLLGAMDAMN